MENRLIVSTETRTVKAGGRFLALLLACVLMFSLAACGGQHLTGKSENIEPVTVEREPEPQALQTANEATAIALRQYIYARLLTETFLAEDASGTTMGELSEKTNELLLAWESTELFSSVAEELSGRAALLLDAPTIQQTSASGLPQARFMTFGATPTGFQSAALAVSSPQQLDPQIWAENLTKQYDAIKGAQRYQQLARQLGTDAKTAYEQMQLAQEIIYNQATEDAAFWDKMTKAAQAAKTASKVTMLGWSMVATGGGSVALLEGAGILVGGVDCIVDVAETGSTIILGENNQVAVAFGDIKEKLGPVSSLIGLGTLNPSDIGKTAKDTTEALVYITDSLVDLFYEDKIVGIKVEGLSEQAASISGQVFETDTKIALEAAGFLFPQTTKTLLEITESYRQAADIEIISAQMDALVSQMAELEQAAGITVEASPGYGGIESAPPQTPAGNASIFGTYTCVTTYKSDDNTETGTIIIRDRGNGTLVWIDEDGDETHLSYDQATNVIHTESEGLTVHVEFYLSGNTIIGDGYISGIFWDNPVEAALTLTKTSD